MRKIILLTVLFTLQLASAKPVSPNFAVIWEKVPSDVQAQITQAIPSPLKLLKKTSQTVVETLYFPKEKRREVSKIRLIFADFNGVAAKSNAGPEVTVRFSTKWGLSTLKKGGADALRRELRGVLLHEVTHAWQLEPQGIGNYGNSRVFWAFIEGMADAVRLINDGFEDKAKVPNAKATYLDGYRTTGDFLVWVTRHKDKKFLRKLNSTTRILAEKKQAWSFDAAVKEALGKTYSIEKLWQEYLKSQYSVFSIQ